MRAACGVRHCGGQGCGDVMCGGASGRENGRSIALISAHALPLAGFGHVNILARSLAWGMARKHAIPTISDRDFSSR